MKKTASKIFTILGTALLASSLLATPSVAASNDVAPAPIQLSDFIPAQQEPDFEEITKDLSENEIELLTSGAPAVIYQEVRTANITKVESASNAETFSLLPASQCSGGITACLYGKVPYPNYAFTGIGSKTGTWTNRVSYRSPSKTMQACDAYTCYAIARPGQLVKISAPTTMKSVSVY